MQEKDTIQYIEAIKLACGSVQYKNISIKETFFDTVLQLLSYFENSNNKDYLEIALLHIQAYLEMGFPYEDGGDIFDSVLEKMKITKEFKFPKKFYKAKIIKLNKSQVRSMIKKWPASPRQTMKIDEVVNDIINKVQMKEMGIHYYKCAVIGDLYELTINENELFFHDLRRGFFYSFEI